VGVTALAGGAGLIIAIATRQSPQSPSAAARSAEMAPATPPSAAPPPSEEPLPAADPIETTPVEIAGDPPAASSTPGPTPPSAAAETTGRAIRVKIANPRPGLRATVDGRATSLPVRLPRDNKVHVLSFTAPNFKPETKTVVADQDHTLTLEYHPKLYVP
jgi:hypothetical protein